MTIEELVKQSEYYWDWLEDADTEDADVKEKQYVNGHTLFWHDGIWNSGNFYMGMWYDGVFKGGKFCGYWDGEEYAEFHGGRFEDGTLILDSYTNWHGGEFIGGEVEITGNPKPDRGVFKFSKDTITLSAEPYPNEDELVQYTYAEWEEIFSTDCYSDELIEMGKVFAEPNYRMRKEVEKDDYKNYEVNPMTGNWAGNKKWSSRADLVDAAKEKLQENYESVIEFRDKFFARVEKYNN